MSKAKKPTRRQHFVPQWHLRKFATDGRVHVFDKPTQRTFATSPKNIGAKNDFYTLPFDDPESEPLTESVLGLAEQEAAKVVTRVLGGIEYYVSKFPALQQALYRSETYSSIQP